MADMPTTAAANDETLGLEQAATLLHLGLEAMKDLVREGAVPALQLNQKHTVLLRADLLAYVREEGRKQAEQRRRMRKGGNTQPVDAASSRTRRARAPKPDLSRYEAQG